MARKAKKTKKEVNLDAKIKEAPISTGNAYQQYLQRRMRGEK